MGVAYATATDVAARWRPLTATESATADVLCGDASNLIRARFPDIDSQVTAGTMDADVLTQVVAGMVKRVMVAPADGITSQNESIGPFSHAQSYANPLGNVFLTQADLTLILGYRPAAQTVRFSNTTTRIETAGPGIVYGGDTGSLDAEQVLELLEEL